MTAGGLGRNIWLQARSKYAPSGITATPPGGSKSPPPSPIGDWHGFAAIRWRFEGPPNDETRHLCQVQKWIWKQFRAGSTTDLV